MPRDPTHPRTPDPMEGMSNRSWLGYVSAWRRQLHLYDGAEEEQNLEERMEREELRARKKLEHETRKKIVKSAKEEEENMVFIDKEEAIEQLFNGESEEVLVEEEVLDSDDDLL